MNAMIHTECGCLTLFVDPVSWGELLFAGNKMCCKPGSHAMGHLDRTDINWITISGGNTL